MAATDLAVPKVSWFPGFFNPQSFLTAVMQSTARRNEWPLDKTTIQVGSSRICHVKPCSTDVYTTLYYGCVYR